jgi:hypothetical protein
VTLPAAVDVGEVARRTTTSGEFSNLVTVALREVELVLARESGRRPVPGPDLSSPLPGPLEDRCSEVGTDDRERLGSPCGPVDHRGIGRVPSKQTLGDRSSEGL